MKHSFNLAALAAVAILSGCAAYGAQRTSPVSGAELGNKPVDASRAAAGATVFRAKGCDMCHAFGRNIAGPDLAGVMERRDHDWLRKWLKETNAMLQSDPQAIDMLKQWNGVKMPQVKLQDTEIESLFHYMAQETARRQSGS